MKHSELRHQPRHVNPRIQAKTEEMRTNMDILSGNPISESLICFTRKLHSSYLMLLRLSWLRQRYRPQHKSGITTTYN